MNRKKRKPLVNRKSFIYQLANLSTWLTIRPLFIGRLRVVGLNNVPAIGAALLAVNHNSHLDGVILAWIIRRYLCFIARLSLTKNRVIGYILKGIRAIYVKRDGGDGAAVLAAFRALKAGILVVIFPEGTRSQDGKIGPFMEGTVALAKKAEVPLLPVRILGTDVLLPPGQKWFRRTDITVIIGKAVNFKEVETDEELRAIIDGLPETIIT